VEPAGRTDHGSLWRTAGGWRYDHDRQLALTLDGHLITEIIAADPTADTVTDLDGDEGKSEDWKYDFCPDSPGSPA
jgi:hypothetical protein